MIDIDKLFEDYFRKFMAENIGKLSEDEIENRVPELYDAFGNEPNDSLGGKSPKDFFLAYTDEELIETLKESVKNGIEISSFLCDEIEKRSGMIDRLCSLVSAEVDDELATYAVNMLSGKKLDKKNLERFVDVMADDNAGESLSEALTEVLRDNGDEVKEKIIAGYGKNPKRKANFLEIMSRTSPDDRIFEILCDELERDDKNIALNAAYVARYGDERALPILDKMIKSGKVSKYDLKELKNAYEELGGEL